VIENLRLTAGPAADTAPAGGVRTSYEVLGMTCGHCAGAVTEELTAVDGVTSVDVDLVPGGTSRVHVRSASPLERSVVAAAVDEAGYALATH
jgi:copper chaperone